jgi:hypothetical protein
MRAGSLCGGATSGLPFFVRPHILFFVFIEPAVRFGVIGV